jgi:YD repeat-containing protein
VPETADSVVEFARDEHGPRRPRDDNGRTVSFGYDADRNPIRRRTPSGVDGEWSFDPADNPAALLTAGHAVRYSYDPRASRPAGRWTPPARSGSTFERSGRLAAQLLTAGPVTVQQRTSERLADGSLAGIRDAVGGHTALNRDIAGRITEAISTGLRENLRYDAAGNVVATNAWPASRISKGFDLKPLL